MTTATKKSLGGLLSFAQDEQDVFDVLESLDTAYEIGEPTINPLTDEPVSDPEYDLIRQEAQRRFPNNPYWDKVTGSTHVPSKIVRLDIPMTSLDKKAGPTREKDYKKWIADCREELGPDVKFDKSLKRDGTGVSLKFVNGKFVNGGLRPRNGYDAEDRTANLRKVIGIPTELPLPLTCMIRGELYVSRSDFAHINADPARRERKSPFENERNYTTGSVRNDDVEITARRRIQFVAHSIVGLENWQDYYKTERERAIWCNKVLRVPYVRTEPLDPDDLNDLYNLEKVAETVDYLTDGIVCMVSDLESQEQMGTHGGKVTGNPVGKIAWKPSDEEKVTKVKELSRQTGRTGKVTPVAWFDPPVRLAGTTVRKASLHNRGRAESWGVTVGTEVAVIKANAIIPQVVRVLSGQGKWTAPYTCPECGHGTHLMDGDDGAVQEFCTNRECPAQIVHTLLHYLSTFGVRDVGGAKVRILVENGLVKKPGDFYRLDIPALMSVGLSERQSLIALAGIHMIENPSKEKDNGKLSQRIGSAMQVRKPIPMWQLCAALGIRGAGKGTGKALVDHFRDLTKIREATMDELIQVPDVGEITAVSLRTFFEENAAMIDDLLQFVEPEQLPTDGPFKGYTFVLSGSFKAGKLSDSKDWYEKAITERLGKVASSVSKKMVPVSGEQPRAFLVAGPGSGAKFEKAKELGVPIIDVDDLERMLT